MVESTLLYAWWGQGSDGDPEWMEFMILRVSVSLTLVQEVRRFAQVVFEVGTFGLSDELVMPAGGVLVGCEAVFGGLEGVVRVGVDFEGGFVGDGYSPSDSVGEIPSDDLVAVRDGYCDVGRRVVVPPGFGQEGYVWGGGVEQVPELDGVLA
ncbi:hypothetical protein NDU88_004503 [Pleurodeles waltl]|uniref:Uncharacterized protein n=1 Tax=Pleurodeles waltl TaxID=8319 RepID=A0AAV7QF36_PLEWA|nr:hypothetical protein NDU88_004503 [Pleurodeles waltl]